MFLLSFLCTIISNLSIMLCLLIHKKSRWKLFWKIVWRRSMQEEKLNILIAMSILCWMNMSNNKWLMSYEAVELMSSLRNESRFKLWNSLIVQCLIFWWIVWCWCVKKIVVICSWLICFLWTWRMRISSFVRCTLLRVCRNWIEFSSQQVLEVLTYVESLASTLYSSAFDTQANLLRSLCFALL